MKSKIVQRINNGTCALGIVKSSIEDLKHSRKPEDYEIVGTGFLVRSDTIVTNRHVALEIAERMQKYKLPPAHAQARFVYLNEPGQQILYCPLRRCNVVANPIVDAAVIDFERDDSTDPPDFVKSVNRLSILENIADLRLGEPIAAMGYAYGNLLHSHPTDPETLVRYGPILQQGHISGFQPWEQTTAIEELLLDIRSIGGMSGSPVFRRKTGQVIGLIYGGITQKVGTASVDHAVLARAVPLDWVRLNAWLQLFDTKDDQGLLKY